jgi:hypothetical protein
MKNLKIGKTVVNIDAVKGMKKEDFVAVYKNTNLFNPEEAWKTIESHIKSEEATEKKEAAEKGKKEKKKQFKP